MIDLERLEAHLDLALADELREHRIAAVASLTSSPPAPDPAPVPAAPSRRSHGGDRTSGRRRSSSPTSPSSPLPPRPAPRHPNPSSPAVSAAFPSLAPLAPPEAVWDDLDIEQHARMVVDLVGRGCLAEADLHIAAHAELVHGGSWPEHRGDALAWSVMRALLDGRERAARTGVDALLAWGRDQDDPDGDDRYWVQRLWVALNWGGDEERYELLDHCRRRAWCRQDIPWRGRLTLLLAHLGRTEEAAREFDATVTWLSASAGPRPSGSQASSSEADRLDLATDLAEAAAILGDGHRSGLVRHTLGPARMETVVAGRAWICKGSVARFQALAAATSGEVDESDRWFHAAAEAHRRMGADLLLAWTLAEWGRSLTTRDAQRSGLLLRESAELSRRLGLSRAGSEEVTARAS